MIDLKKPLKEEDRQLAMRTMWVGLAMSILLLVGAVTGMHEVIASLTGGITAGTFIGLAFIRRQDEYFQRLIAFAARWACVVVGIWLGASILSFTKVYAEAHMIWLALTAVTFQLAFTLARLRGV